MSADGAGAWPTELRVDYERQPGNVDVDPERPPRLHWSVAGDDRGARQSAYRVRVAADRAALADLEEGEAVWDGVGTPGEWSAPSQFTTAVSGTGWPGEWIRGPADGRAPPPIDDGAWIWHSDGDPGPRYFRGTVEVDPDRALDSAAVLVAAADRARLWVNGDPAWRTLDWAQDHLTGRAEAFDATTLLEPGGNRIAVAADGHRGDERAPGLCLRLRLSFEDGTERTVDADGEWATARGAAGWAGPADTEWEATADGAAAWTIGDDDRDWSSPAERDAPLTVEVPDRVAPPPAPLVRTERTFDRPIRRARAHVAVGGVYELYVNGERVGEQVLDPAQTDYEETVLFATHDVTGLLEAGENAVGLALGRERYGEWAPSVWNWHRAPWWEDPAVALRLEVEFEDGTTETVATGDDWRATDGPTRFDSFYAGEVYDARHERPGWTEPGYDDGDWDPAVVAAPPAGNLRPQRAPPIEVVDTVTPVERTEPADGTYVFDVGQLVNGWVRLGVAGEPGTRVRLRTGERLHDDGTVDAENRHIAPPMQVDDYVLAGEGGDDGRETWEPRFGYRGFRYVQVEGYPGEPTAGDVEARIVHSPVGDDSGFACSNELLNRVHGNTRRALSNNFVGIETASNYEKNGWTGDALATAEAALYNFDLARFYRKWLDDFADAQRDSGELPCIVPTSDWGYADLRGITAPNPGWDALYVYLPWWLYRYCGDEQVLARHFDGMAAYVDYLGTYADDGIVDVGLGDWLPPGGGEGSPLPPEGPAVTSTAFYADCARVLAEAGDVLGREGAAATYRSLHGDVRRSLNDAFLDSEAGVYATGEADEYRQTPNVFPLAFDLVPDAHVDSVVENLVRDVVETRDGHLNTGFHGTRLLLPVLSEYGHHEVAYTVATRTDYPSWGNWITSGMTSLLEAWTLASRSRDHHFLGSIDEWFYGYLAGIRPGAPGFERVEIAPRPAGDLTWAAADVDTVRGTVRVHWGRSMGPDGVPDAFSLDVTVPPNATGTVRIPTLGADDPSLSEGGVPVRPGSRSHPSGVETVGWNDERVTVAVASGTYRFELTR